MNTVQNPPRLELTRPFRASDVLGDDREFTVTASEAECAALAHRFGFVEIQRLQAIISLTRWRRKGVKASGRLDAGLSQRCTVTLEPVAEQVNEVMEAVFWPAERAAALADDGRRGEAFSDLDQEEIPELYEDDSIDLGELTAEWLAVCVNPYPRLEGAELPDAALDGDAGDSKRADSPFQVLSALKTGGE